MNWQLAERLAVIKPSATLAIAAKAQALRASGQKILSLSVGEPDFPTPAHVLDAASRAMADGFTRYTPVDGLPSLKQAIIAKLKRDNGLSYEPKEIIATVGCKQAIYNLLQAYINPGDEVIIPAPYWVSYPEMTALAGGVPVAITTTADQHYKINPEQLERAITPRTRALILNSPSNPTGMAYRQSELKALGDVLKRHPQILILSDDIYEYFQWTGEAFANIATLVPELKPQTVVFNGVSKAYAMTGWRIGYAAGPQALITGMETIQSQSTSNPCSIAQKAAEAALLGDQGCIETMRQAYQTRHKAVVAALNSIPGVRTLPADGTFYIFPDFTEAMKRKGYQDDTQLAEYLLNTAGVAIVPGGAFGAPGCLRLSFATSQAILDEAFDRMANALR